MWRGNNPVSKMYSVFILKLMKNTTGVPFDRDIP